MLELIPPTVTWLCRCWTYHNSILASCFDVWLVYLLSMSVSRTIWKSKLCNSLFDGNRKSYCMSYFDEMSEIARYKDKYVTLQKQMAVSFENTAKSISNAQLCCAKYFIWTCTVKRWERLQKLLNHYATNHCNDSCSCSAGVWITGCWTVHYKVVDVWVLIVQSRVLGVVVTCSKCGVTPSYPFPRSYFTGICRKLPISHLLVTQVSSV